MRGKLVMGLVLVSVCSLAPAETYFLAGVNSDIGGDKASDAEPWVELLALAPDLDSPGEPKSSSVADDRSFARLEATFPNQSVASFPAGESQETAAAAVPEPASLAIAGLGVLSFLRIRQRRRL